MGKSCLMAYILFHKKKKNYKVIGLFFFLLSQ